MWVCRYFLYFIVCSFMGWLFECVYGVVVTGKWENRGFLFGPICPIYGVGVVSVMGLLKLCRIHGYTSDRIPNYLIFALAFAGSILLEYSTHYLLERRFHACWWDYSNMPFNIRGRVCLPASLAFGFAGILVVRYLVPELNGIALRISPIAIEAGGMAVLSLMTVDATLTISALTDFEERVRAADASLNDRMDNLVTLLEEKKDDAHDWLIEGKDRIYQFSTDTVVDYMSAPYKAAISRISSFRELPGRVPGALTSRISATTSRTTAMMNHTLKVIKRRISKGKSV